MVEPTLALGAAVATAACKLWLKDIPFAEDVSAKAIDIIQHKISGVREQRRAARIFEGIEEAAADFITASMNHEFRDLPDNERQAAIIQATAALARTPLSVSDLLASDLDPLYLARNIRRYNPDATRDLGSAAATLYESIIQRCCSFIVSSANSLPDFEVGAFSELLRRQTETIHRLERVAIDLAAMGTNNANELFESTYRNLVIAQLDQVQLFGFTVSDRLRRYPLSASYLPLTAASSLRDDPGGQELSLENEAARVGSIAPDSVHDLLARSSRTLIRGDAGSGKTTLLQWLAVSVASDGIRGPLRHWRRHIPFFIRLRQYVGTDLPTPESFLEGVGRHISDEMPRGWVQRKLRDGKALVLVDGIDEFPSTSRIAVREWLRELVAHFPDAKYIVTSRPAAASSTWLDSLGFANADLEPMNVSSSQELVRLWHTAMRSTAADTDEVDRITEAESALADALVSRRHLRQIASNPLLAAMLCALHLDRRMQLPSDKIELYSVAIEALVERRDIERRIVQDDKVELPKAARLLILEDLSYWMIRNGLTSAPRERVEARIAGRIGGIPRVTCSGAVALDVLLNRSGLVREPIPGMIDFIHRTFQEYLAARAAVDADDIEIMLTNASNDQWRETIVSACGLAHAAQREQLINGILSRIAVSGSHESGKLKAVAVACLQASPHLSPVLQEELRRLASGLLPPRSNAMADSLALAGELALELLPPGLAASDRSAAATVRLAGLVGGEHGLRVIESYANPEVLNRYVSRGSFEVIRQMEQAWDRFDVVAFAQRVFANLPHYWHLPVDDPIKLPALKHARPSGVELNFRRGNGDLSFVQDLPGMTSLHVRRDFLLTDLAPLVGHPALKQLVLDQVGPLSLAIISSIETLIDLELNTSSGIDIGDLREFPHLKQLQLLNSEALPSVVLRSLDQQMRLERIGFWDAPGVTDLDVFLGSVQLANLKFLLMGEAVSFTSISGIAEWAATCTGLYFVGASNLINVQDLAGLPRLNFLNLTNCPIVDVSFVESLPELRTLHIGGAANTPSLEPLVGHPGLERIYIRGDDPIDLTALRDCPSLTDVHISKRKPAEVRGLASLPEAAKVKSGR